MHLYIENERRDIISFISDLSIGDNADYMILTQSEINCQF